MCTLLGEPFEEESVHSPEFSRNVSGEFIGNDSIDLEIGQCGKTHFGTFKLLLSSTLLRISVWTSRSDFGESFIMPERHVKLAASTTLISISMMLQSRSRGDANSMSRLSLAQEGGKTSTSVGSRGNRSVETFRSRGGLCSEASAE